MNPQDTGRPLDPLAHRQFLKLAGSGSAGVLIARIPVFEATDENPARSVSVRLAAKPVAAEHSAKTGRCTIRLSRDLTVEAGDPLEVSIP